MLVGGLGFFVTSVVFTRVWNLIFDDSESWASTLLSSAISAVIWISLMRWWFRRQLRRHGT